MRLVINGAESELTKIIKENAIREKRGLISFEIEYGEEQVAAYEGARRGRKKKEPEIEGKADIEAEPKGDADIAADNDKPEVETK